MNIDTQSLGELYDKVYRYCYFKLQNRELAEDVTQEAFLRCIEARGYTEIGKSLHYLYTIARNLCIDEYRRKKSSLSTAELTDELPSFDPTDELTTGLAVRKALSSLDDSERELLLLRHVNEVPIASLAKLYGISRFALHRRLTRAEKHLRDLLEKEDIK